MEDVKYASNYVKTSKFTWWNFVPLALALQFKRIPNLFWLFNFGLQCIPEISTRSPSAIAIPLTIVFVVGILKEFIADSKRKKHDKYINSIPVKKVNLGNQPRKAQEKGLNLDFKSIRTDEL